MSRRGHLTIRSRYQLSWAFQAGWVVAVPVQWKRGSNEQSHASVGNPILTTANLTTANVGNPVSTMTNLTASTSQPALVLYSPEPGPTSSAPDSVAPPTSPAAPSNSLPAAYLSDPPAEKHPNHGGAYAAVTCAVMVLVIGLVLYMVYRKHKANAPLGDRIGNQRTNAFLSEKRTNPLSGLTKSMIQHVSHDEKRKRHTFFSTPDGRWRFPTHVKTFSSSSASPLQPSASSEGPPRVLLDRDEGDSEGSAKTGRSSTTPFASSNSPADGRSREENQQASQRITVIRFAECAHKRRSSLPEGAPIRLSRFSERFPNLTARLQNYKAKATGPGRIAGTRHSRSNSSPAISEKLYALDTSVRRDEETPSGSRSPSIIATPPAYMKSGGTEGEEEYGKKLGIEVLIEHLEKVEEEEHAKKPGLSVVVKHLETDSTEIRPSYCGRGESYFWKSPPRSKAGL